MGECVVSTTDFFTPIVDSPYDFGRIAAANAISDVYAMGGKPLMALALLAWPLDKLPKSAATEVVNGARSICDEAGIPLAGGHSINIQEVLFGLAVTGTVRKSALKTNAGAHENDIIYLTKRIGTGMLSSALKRGEYTEHQLREVITQMCTLNALGPLAAAIPEVHAMTDVTGFGLAGHLLEMAEGSNLTAVISMQKLPLFQAELIDPLIASFKLPNNTMRNFKSYGHKCSQMDGRNLALLCDPQTNGGLLISVSPAGREAFIECCHEQGVGVTEIGVFESLSDNFLKINP
jgi:selenide,water dikinase